MIYYAQDGLVIRDMEKRDIAHFVAWEREQGWNSSPAKFEDELKDHADGRAIPLTAEYAGEPAGYVSVYPNSLLGSMGGRGYTEIVDFAVLEKYRRHGIGSCLMDVAERIAAGYSRVVYLGVGLHNGYGSAQRMYAKRGYIPDGTGV